MLSLVESLHGNGKMGKVRRTDGNSIKLVAHLIKHFPEILVSWRIGEHLDDFLGLFCTHVHITKRDNIALSGLVKLLNHLVGSISYSYADQIKSFIGTIELYFAQNAVGKQYSTACHNGFANIAPA